MSKRPKFTIAQVTEQFDVSRSTMRRGLNNGRFPNATKDHHGRWNIPVDDVLQAGFTPRKTWLNEPAHEPVPQVAHEPGQPAQSSVDDNEKAGFMNQVHLENELAHERAQVDKLKALLEAERAHVESLRMALRMIEPSKVVPSEGSTPEPSLQEQNPARNHSSQRPRTVSLLHRLFRGR